MPVELHSGFEIRYIFAFGPPSELTIAGGAITVDRSYHMVDTEGDIALDNLDTINGGTDRQILLLRTVDNARDVVVRHNVGNILLSGNANVTLNETRRMILLMWRDDINFWVDIAKPAV